MVFVDRVGVGLLPTDCRDSLSQNGFIVLRVRFEKLSQDVRLGLASPEQDADGAPYIARGLPGDGDRVLGGVVGADVHLESRRETGICQARMHVLFTWLADRPRARQLPAP